MHIAIVTTEFGENSGGLSYSCTTFSKMLKDFGYEITVISSIYNSGKDSFSNPDFQVIYSNIIICDGGYKELKDHLFFRAHIRNVIEETKNINFDYIISFGAGFNGLFASELSRELNVKLIVLLRGSEINLSISDYELRDANFQCLKNTYMVIGLSKELVERSKSIFFSANILYKVIPNPIEEPLEIIIPKTKRKKIKLGCGSTNLNEKKGVANLIAMVSILNLNKDISFNIEFVGNIDPDLFNNYKELCSELKVSDSVKFIGKISREDFIKRMKFWDFYVQGSFCEGFSNSVADFISLGKTFILSNSGFIAEKIKEENPEIVFEDFNPINMANKIIALISNPNIKTIYKNAYRKVLLSTNRDILRTKWQSILEAYPSCRANGISKNENILSVIFHDISENVFSNIDTPVETFRSFVTHVFQNGYILCSTEQFFSSIDRSNLIICTFDDAYSGIIRFALPILKTFGFTATVFVCHDYMGKQNHWNLKDPKLRRHLDISELQMLQSEGWEIGSHGLTHNSLLRLSDSDLINELHASKFNLEKHFAEIKTYAYPYGDYNEYCKLITKQIYKSAFAMTKGGTLEGIDNHQIRRYFIPEILKKL